MVRWEAADPALDWIDRCVDPISGRTSGRMLVATVRSEERENVKVTKE